MNNSTANAAFNDHLAPLPVRFPLAGEWLAANSPGHKIPSHGTNALGQRYAYDFVTPNDMEIARRFVPGLQYWLGGGIPVAKTGSWNSPILAPISGKVIAAKDGWPEPAKASGMGVVRAFTNSFTMSEKSLRLDMRQLTGNYLILEGKNCFAFLAHATTGSIRVSEGAQITAGQHIANVGHTGNSTRPHLHFQLMDRADLWTANGLPCCFEKYEQFTDGEWLQIENGIPDNVTPIRVAEGTISN